MADTSGYQAISFYDPDTGTVVQIEEENLERVDFSQSDMETEKTTARGNKPFVGHVSELEVETWDWTGLSQLKTWAENDTPISFVALGYQRNIQWYEKDRISLSLDPKSEAGSANTYVVSMRREGGGAHDIHNYMNLLHYLGWTDDDSDGIADGYTMEGGQDSTSFSSDQQSLFDSSTFTDMFASVTFPIEGMTFTMSSQWTQLHGSATNSVLIAEKDFSDTTLATSQTTVSATGRKNTELTTQANVYSLKVMPLRLQSVSASDKASVKYPALRVDGSETYVAH